MHFFLHLWFAAIKVTALGNPKLLERVSACLVQCRALFSRFDTDNRGYEVLDFESLYYSVSLVAKYIVYTLRNGKFHLAESLTP